MSPPVPSTILAFPSNHGNRLKVCTGKGREGVSGGGGGGGGVGGGVTTPRLYHTEETGNAVLP